MDSCLNNTKKNTRWKATSQLSCIAMDEFLSDTVPTLKRVGKIDAGQEVRIALRNCSEDKRTSYESLVTKGLLQDTDNGYDDYGNVYFNGKNFHFLFLIVSHSVYCH